jgi:DNA-binding NtrC family response regulator
MPAKIRILIVDDELSVRDSLRRWFAEEGCTVDVAENAKDALHKLAAATWDVFLLDIRMPGMDGLDLQQRIVAAQPDATIIIMTAYASVDSAVRAMKQGAHDYITKPFDPDAVERLVHAAVERRRLEKESGAVRPAGEAQEGAPELVGDSAAMQEVRKLIDAVATSDSAVLIEGERGTGKESVARAIHLRGARRYMPFVVVGASGLADADAEADLLGMEKGAGAAQRRRGKLELADGGTLFVDDIEGLGPRAQEALVRALTEKGVCRVGGGTRVPADVRAIGSTGVRAESLAGSGKVRQDLLARLTVFVIRLPALRERREDIGALALHFLERAGRKMSRAFEGLSPAALRRLAEHDWPGNVRELQNAVERAAVLRPGGVVQADDLLLGGAGRAEGPAAEKEGLRRVLEATGWNLGEAARLLELDKVDLFEKLRAYGLERPATRA